MESCGLCGHNFGTAGTQGTPVDSRRILSERADWSTSYINKQCATGRTEEPKKIYFEIPWIWERLQRAVIQVPSQNGRGKDEYRLSGVALSGDWNHTDRYHMS